MNKTNLYLHSWVTVMLLTMLGLVFPIEESKAADGDFDNPQQAFSWYSKGPGCIHLKILVHDASAKRSLKDGKFAVKGDGIDENFMYVDENSSANSAYMVTDFRNLLTTDNQLLYLTNDYNVSPLYYIGNTLETRNVKRESSGGKGYAEFDWYYPTRYAGKTLTLYLHGASIWEVGDGKYHTYTTGNKDLGTIEFDEINFSAYDVIPGVEDGDEATVKIPFSCDRVIKWVEATWVNEDGIKMKVPRQTLPKNSYNGYVKLPATVPHKNLTITANVVSGSPSAGDASNPDWPKECAGNITLEYNDDAIIHNPRMLSAEILSDPSKNPTDAGSVLLKWKTSQPTYADLLEGDMFLIERSLTGKMEDYEAIGYVAVDSETDSYEFKDSTFISSLTPELIDKRANIPLVRYRVVRASTQQLWGMDKNPTASYVQPQMGSLQLIGGNGEVKWSNETERKVLVTWKYVKNSQSFTYVWDPRAEMSLRVSMYNNDNKLVGQTTTVLTDKQIAEHQAELTLERSCVNYTIDLCVMSKKSPIGNATGDIFVQIRNSNDYEVFSRDVKNDPTLNAILFTDVDVSDIMIGTEEVPYTGNFNGNGHKVTVTLKKTMQAPQYVAPFRYVANGAVIANLTVEGVVTAFDSHAGGLVAKVAEGSVFIENCQVATSVNTYVPASKKGEHGGVVAQVSNDGNLYLANTLFNGGLISQTSNFTSDNAGFVGFREGNGFVRISNSYFDPAGLNVNYVGSGVFIRNDNDDDTYAVLDDCFYKTIMGAAQCKQSDTAPDNLCWKDGKPATEERETAYVSDGMTYGTNGPKFYFENIGEVDPSSVDAQTLPSSVILTWRNKDENPVDYYEVWRRDAKETDFSRIATQIIDLQYEDKSTSPVHSYYYYVRGVTDCEGTKWSDTNIIPGHCVQTGSVEGFLRFPDGTGIPAQDIVVTSEDKSVTRTATTDESGYYFIEGLPYFNETATNYTASVNLNGFSGLLPVNFGTEPGKNIVTGIDFVVEKSVKFSGYVQYSGTSIPVQGVSFLVDGREVHTASGKVVSDHEGKFSFRILEGDYTIQAVKEGHVFYQKGYYYENNDTTKKEHHFDIDKSGIYFYDDTKVKLIGRVAGGKDQAALPLGNSLSHNNLGDDIQIVMALEGDNKSRLVWDIQDRNKKECDTVYHHTSHDKLFDYQTQVHTTINRMVVKPDVHTGEYQVFLPPVKWKIMQITAKGYATLFQDGKTGDVIDLSDSLTLHTDHYTGSWKSLGKNTVKNVDVTYNAIYNRIYHSPVIIDYKQLGYEPFDYFGERYYNAKNLAGESSKVPLCYPVRKANWPAGKKDSLEAKYVFGYPVFRIERSYPVKISATERYCYNNNTKSDTVDVVRLSGGLVTIQNGLVSSTHRETVELDSVGEYVYYLESKQIPYLLTKKDALRTVTMTLLMDGTHYEATPLRAFLLNQTPVAGAKDLLTINKPTLIDVLRDPPGGGSSAKLSKGSTLKYSHEFSWNVKGGLSLGFEFGHALSVLQAAGVGVVIGTISSVDNTFAFSIDLIVSGSGKEAYSYTMTNNVDISTSSVNTMVGADADVYIGMEESYVMKPTVAIRAIPESMWVQLQGEKEAGRLVEIARGYDEEGAVLHLVRDEIVGIQTKVNSTFAHSQSYILGQLIPKLRKESQSLLFTGTQAEAQQLANKTKKNVYLSLRQPDDPDFGLVNTKKVVEMGDESWEYFFNTKKTVAADGINYLVVRPEGSESEEDKIAEFSQSMLYWAAMIAQNEQEKLEAKELVRSFEIDGGAPLTYSEEFSSESSATGEIKFPWDGSLSKLGATVLGSLAKLLNKKTHTEKTNDMPHFDARLPGYKFGLTFGPAFEYNLSHPYSESKKYNRKESFSMSMDKKSHMMIDVYRVQTKVDTPSAIDKYDIFVNQNFNDLTNEEKSEITHSGVVPQVDELSESDLKFAKSFVYRTRGGATCRPWEPERQTVFYQGGTVLDERTKKIENPVIKMDKQSISGVPMDEPARFKLYMTNESEAPEAIGGTLRYFTLYLDEMSNPKGARLLIDGMPLSRAGMTVMALPGQVTEKTLEVWAGEDFDYENLKIGLISQGDVQCVQEAQFSVHFLQTAGSVAISMPGDKWIMNTDAPFEENKGWYLPVVISGFNKYQKNFDHIEFQYKETTRGDDYWTNLCGFYADSTVYAAASGTKEMIPENGNIITRFFGEGMEIEKAYDLRAVLFCRNGNGFLTNNSKVLSGVKDTCRPQLFGSVDPKDGVLGAGENIIFNFSEDIEYNYLQETTNFEVKGETNETAISEEPSLQFEGNGYAESEARRNFADKSVTIEVMIKPDDVGKDMPIFSHGRDGKQLQLWLTKEKYLKAVVDDHVLLSKEPFKALGFQRVALVLDNKLKRLSIISDKLDAEMDSIIYSGYGPVIFGATNQTDVNKRKYYSGRMLQGRVWNRAMDLNLLNAYGNQMLTGYEMGLTDYYPMNDGKGDYASDGAQGAHLKLSGTSWALPRGMSLKLDMSEKRNVKGLEIRSKYINRSAEKDYTLMFWFKTDSDGRGALLANGSGRKTDVDAKNKFFIGFEGETLKYRAYGREYALGKTFSDGDWHHIAVTMNRAHQLGCVYVDNDLKAQFSADSIGGISGSCYLGNMVWQEEGLHNEVIHQQNAFSGNIDALVVFEQALPPSLIKRYANKSLGGKEKGLITFMDFARQVRQKNGDLTLQPFALNQVVKEGLDGEASEEHDSVFVDPVADILKRIDSSEGAPVQAYEELRNLNFNFVGRDNQLLVNINELDSRINKRMVHVTVSSIPDLNGNFMASPQTMSVFVDRNPLRWAQKTLKINLGALYDHDYTFDVNVVNNSGASHTFTIENMPKWLSVNTYSDVIDAKTEQTLTFSVNKDTNVGNYDDIIYLVDENGLSEPLMLNITIEGENPYWDVDPSMKQFSMSIIGRVQIGDDIVTDSRDIVGVFDSTGRCMACGNVNYDPISSESLIYLTVYDSLTTSRPLGFFLWHYETGKTMVLTPSQSIEFKPESYVGTTKNPVILKGGSQYVQTIDLYPGWNWISMNVTNNDYRDVEKFLGWFKWQEGDMLTDETNNFSLLYKYGQWISNKGTTELANSRLSVSRSYRVKVKNYVKVQVTGNAIKAVGDRTIDVKTGWNSIGYTPMVNLPVATAMSDYLDDAEDGDLLKSKTEFAMFTKGDNGSREWKGNLKYMKPGEGYMLYRQREGETSFFYPFYEPNATFFEESSANRAPMVATYAQNMTLTAVADGVDLQEGDRMIAYSGAEMRGEAVVTEGSPLYMTIAGDQKAPLSFAIERDGTIIAATGEIMTYQTNAISGSPAEPTKISFVRYGDMPQNGWYSVQGIKLDKQPVKSGVYIYNGKKQVVK